MKDDRKLLRTKEFIDKCDADFALRLENIAKDIVSKKDIRLVRLSGPTCSGKTTAADMLTRAFKKYGKRALTISIDDFYLDTHVLKSNSKKKGLDGIDYDSVETIDLCELERFVEEIFESDEVHCPVFDFKSGSRREYRVLNVCDDDVFIFEGIQAVYPEVTAMFQKHKSVGIFISPMTEHIFNNNVIKPNDLRLMRRLVRDYKYRNTAPEFTFQLWKSVRNNEERSIFPYVDTCEYRVDSTMPYELGVLRPHLEKILFPIKEEDDSYELAQKILRSVNEIDVISDTLIEKDSLYKEFV